MRSGRHGSVVSNPVLVGAVTLLVVNVATVLAWFANRGLPFVPTKEVRVELANGANLLPGNEVREGGYRIGIVSDMQPVPLKDGRVGAIVKLKIDEGKAEFPADTRVAIRPRSVLGLKYVEIQRGTSNRILRNGDTIPVNQTRYPVELDEFQNIFDEKTRDGTRRNLRGWGDALAQRGASLNRTIEELPRFLRHLEPVMTTLDEARIDRFFGELGDFTRVTAPVATRYSHGFQAGADTFEAWSRDPQALQATIAKSGPTMAIGTRSLRTQRPFLSALRDFSIALDETAQELPRTLPRIIPALETGIPVLRRSPQINEQTTKTLATLKDLMEAPGTGAAFRGLTVTTATLNPLVRFLGPYVTVCNYFNYSWTHVAEHLSEPDPTGGSQRTLSNQAGQQVDNTEGSPSKGQRTGVTSLGAAYPANGGEGNGAKQFLHSNNYSAAVDPNGNADCESGQRGYMERNAKYWDKKYKMVLDPHIPGNQGPTFTGRPRVPAGQTFDRHPKIGPTFPAELEQP
jgi:ABC-type transporter Mla subunit MlaD